VKEGRDVDAAVLGGVRREPAHRLLELPLAADSVPAPRLVPGDRDVDEALEKVLLGRLGCAPDVLEGLVRFEVLASLDLRESKS
jgi:hypothetical protein